MISKAKLILQTDIQEFNNIPHENNSLPKKIIADENVSPPSNTFSSFRKTLTGTYIVDQNGILVPAATTSEFLDKEEIDCCLLNTVMKKIKAS